VAFDPTAQPPPRLRVVASTPISEELIDRVVRAEPRIDFVRDQSLLAPQRFAGDHAGDPSFRRTPEQQQAFEDLVDSAQALYGVPDEQPAALRRPKVWWTRRSCARRSPDSPSSVSGAARSSTNPR